MTSTTRDLRTPSRGTSRRRVLWLAGAFVSLAAVVCGDDMLTGDTGADTWGEGDTGGNKIGEPGECMEAVVFDIDETLTISDAEWEKQKADGTYDPVAREGAVGLVLAYADRGYYIVYLTARSKTWVLEGTGETSPEATHRWLVEHEFPIDDGRSRLIMADKVVPGAAARAYKAGALADMQADGFAFVAAYGNAVTDIAAFKDAGIATTLTFIIGEHAGEDGTVAIAGESWQPHLDGHLPTVTEACEAD